MSEDVKFRDDQDEAKWWDVYQWQRQMLPGGGPLMQGYAVSHEKAAKEADSAILALQERRQ